MYTVIIPSCNRINSLLSLLNDISSQTIPPLKLILILQSYRYEDIDKIRFQAELLKSKLITEVIIFDRPYGLARCRVLALDRVTTPLFSFLDDDLSIHSTFFEHAIKFHNSNPDILSCSGYLTNVRSYPRISRLIHMTLPYSDKRREIFCEFNKQLFAPQVRYTEVISGGMTVWKTANVMASLPLPDIYQKFHFFEDVFLSLYLRKANPLMLYAVLSSLEVSHKAPTKPHPNYFKARLTSKEAATLLAFFYPYLEFAAPFIYVFNYSVATISIVIKAIRQSIYTLQLILAIR